MADVSILAGNTVANRVHLSYCQVFFGSLVSIFLGGKLKCIATILQKMRNALDIEYSNYLNKLNRSARSFAETTLDGNCIEIKIDDNTIVNISQRQIVIGTPHTAATFIIKQYVNRTQKEILEIVKQTETEHIYLLALFQRILPLPIVGELVPNISIPLRLYAKLAGNL